MVGRKPNHAFPGVGSRSWWQPNCLLHFPFQDRIHLPGPNRTLPSHQLELPTLLTLHTLACGHQTFYSMTVDLEPSTAATARLLRECGHLSAETRRPLVGKCPSILLSFMYAEACFLGIDSVFQKLLFSLLQMHMHTLLAGPPPLPAPPQSASKRQPQDNSKQPPKRSKLFFPSKFL